MIIGFTAETSSFEKRVAVTPEAAVGYIRAGFTVYALSNCGHNAGFDDASYQQSSVIIKPNLSDILPHSDIVLKINAPSLQEIELLKPHSFLLGNMSNLSSAQITKLRAKHITCFGLERLPRISRAQPFDILSSQNNLAGYQAVIKALSFSGRIAPMMITSAGTISPLKFLIIGAGVAGLQAAATAKRIGGKVYVSDPRPEVKEQVASVGALLIDDISTILPQINIIISSAFGPDKKAPLILTRRQLDILPQGSIIIDMASRYGGNIEGSLEHQNVPFSRGIIYGDSDLAAEVPTSASFLFANNLYNFIMSFYSADTKSLSPDFSDDIISSTCITKG